MGATYGQRAGTFLSNAGVLQVFGVNDHHSASLVSDLLGQETIEALSGWRGSLRDANHWARELAKLGHEVQH